MDAIAARVNARTPKSRGDLKPKTHHFFYGVIVVCGWLAPPLAIAIRFGIGRDFFLNVLLTIMGYFPGHFHNFYCQNIRNNTRRGRTPKWAVKLGLVKVKDPRAGKHQWAGRYDERLPDSARHGYDDTSSIRSGATGEWDGRGPEPSRKARRSSGRHSGGGLTAPWGRVVEPSDVQGGYNVSNSSLDRSNSNNTGAAYDPLTNEQFFSSTGQTDDLADAGRPGSVRGKSSKKGGVKGLMKHRSRYEDQGQNGTGDRFDRMAAARGGSRQDEFQDDFEREINQGSRGGAAPPPSARYDQLDDGPEDAWASSRPATESRSNGRAPASRDDFLNHTF